MEPWVLDEGVKLVRAIYLEAANVGFQVTLGGSVLLKGTSVKDIDLFFLPKTKSSKPSDLIEALTKIWGSPTKIDLKYEDRTRRDIADEQEYLSTRFNPERLGNTGRAGPFSAGRSPLSARRIESYRGMIIEDTRPSDQLVSNTELGTVPVPGDLAYVRRNNGQGPWALVRSGWATASSLGDVPGDLDEVSFASLTQGQMQAAAVVASEQDMPPSHKKEVTRDPFRHALMFMRGKDRIDAFIV